MKATISLVLIIILSTFTVWYMDPDFVINYLSYSTINLLQGKLWTLFTALFIHADLIHLLGNMLFLLAFGNALERELSPAKMLGAFFFGGLLSFLLSSLFYPLDTVMVGASAAIFTLSAISMLVRPMRFSWLLLSPIGLVAILYFLYNAVAVYKGILGEISYISHVIGFLIGIPVGISWSRKWRRNLIITFIMLILYILLLSLLWDVIMSTGASSILRL